MTTHYELLGIDTGASQRQIRKAYLRAVQDNHPDHFPNDPEKISITRKINEAYSILSCPIKRRDYDLILGESSLATETSERTSQKTDDRATSGQAYGQRTRTNYSKKSTYNDHIGLQPHQIIIIVLPTAAVILVTLLLILALMIWPYSQTPQVQQLPDTADSKPLIRSPLTPSDIDGTSDQSINIESNWKPFNVVAISLSSTAARRYGLKATGKSPGSAGNLRGRDLTSTREIRSLLNEPASPSAPSESNPITPPLQSRQKLGPSTRVHSVN